MVRFNESKRSKKEIPGEGDISCQSSFWKVFLDVGLDSVAPVTCLSELVGMGFMPRIDKAVVELDSDSSCLLL